MQQAMDLPSSIAQERQQVYRRTLWVVVIAQILGGLGLAAGVAVGALVAEDMLGSARYAGLPSGVFTLGSAGAAMIVGRISQQRGRRIGLSIGYLAGCIGGIGVVLAIVADNPVMLFAAFLVYGSGTSTSLQARYAGTDVALPSRRGQAVSTILVATTVGAVAGPNLVSVMGNFAESINMPEYSGPFMLSLTAYAFASLVLWIFLRPDPLLYARELVAKYPQPVSTMTGGPTAAVLRRRLLLGASVMVITQIVMVSIMTMTPVHMKAHGHGLSATGFVIGVHIAGMYMFSPLTGYFVDRFGRTPLLIAAAATLPGAGLIAAFAPTDSVPILAVALGLLGLGWNLGLISGTAMVTDATRLETRAAVQGQIDVTVALSGAGGGIMSGVIVNATSYTVLSLIGGALALAMIPIMVMAHNASRQTQPVAA